MDWTNHYPRLHETEYCDIQCILQIKLDKQSKNIKEILNVYFYIQLFIFFYLISGKIYLQLKMGHFCSNRPFVQLQISGKYFQLHIFSITKYLNIFNCKYLKNIYIRTTFIQTDKKNFYYMQSMKYRTFFFCPFEQKLLC